ncbi:putative oxidoreductase [Reticulibacter mediterranei]|uniref:Putative oxidoreductase n=1 Tax=Reticulibacter mediterranei TaxID=2778369 RepID=A0A8J3IZ95_9CHLR|nr:nitroreductase family protein [Reticulibacter mediterranei]GHO97956.1 putative oxidoreductase [Reticulibacter mediterranei]
MSILNLSFDEVLNTTRSVRKRLDLTRPVEPEIIDECLTLALQAPTPGDAQNWHFLVVTDPAKRAALAELHRKAASQMRERAKNLLANAPDEQTLAKLQRMASSAFYLVDHLHEVPVYVIPCVEGRAENLSIIEQAGLWGSIIPATWSFMLAARSRGLGTVLTGSHLVYEREAAEILGIPYDQIMQIALIPVAYTIGTDFKPAKRKPLAEVVHRDRW